MDELTVVDLLADFEKTFAALRKENTRLTRERDEARAMIADLRTDAGKAAFALANGWPLPEERDAFRTEVARLTAALAGTVAQVEDQRKRAESAEVKVARCVEAIQRFRAASDIVQLVRQYGFSDAADDAWQEVLAAAFLQHDSYYKDLSGLPPIQRAEINFDHPNSLETELLIRHISALREGRPVDVPIYDFSTDRRTSKTFTVQPLKVILVEGILIFTEAKLRDLFDVKIFVDTDADLGFIRRLERDLSERGRTTESVIKQYQSTVRPMHLEFVEPSKRYADVIIPEGGFNTAALDMVVARIESLLK